MQRITPASKSKFDSGAPAENTKADAPRAHRLHDPAADGRAGARAGADAADAAARRERAGREAEDEGGDEEAAPPAGRAAATVGRALRRQHPRDVQAASR